jgi:predicted nucleic acid-binding protein
MPGAISDSSTLMHLSMLGRLGLLQEFFGEVLVPPAVWREVVEEGRGRSGSQEVEEAARLGWLKIAAPTNQELVQLLKRSLDNGESEAIALALEHQPEVLLLDESDARRMADVYQLRKTGIIGLLMRAKHEGKLGSLRDELDRLRQEAGFWINDSLYQEVLQAMGESVD